MKILLRITILFLLVFTSTKLQSQGLELSHYASVSVVTCTPGSDLYTSFGHSAIRVQDPMFNIDLIYNYGIFDFYAPNFYVNFVKGKLTYTLGRQDFKDFIFEYELENRTVYEQTLKLDNSSINKLLVFLENNYKPENREYQYDFFYNNCATKIRDILEDKSLFPYLEKNLENKKTTKTFRDLISENLQANGWAQFGINFALGSKIDQETTQSEQQFLPHYVYSQMNEYHINGMPLAPNEIVLLKSAPRVQHKTPLWKTPAFWSIFALFVSFSALCFTLFTGQKLKYLDLVFFGISSIAGLLLLGLWFFTDHQTTANNYNLLWTSPFAWALLISERFLRQNIKKPIAILLLFSLSLTPMIHFLGIQKFDFLFFPIIAALALRTLPLLRN